MNCKPGDLAVTHSMLIPSNNDRLVNVLRMAEEHECGGSSDLAWICESLGSPMQCQSIGGVDMHPRLVRPISDQCLRPIRDPGDDALDESRAWLPSVPLPAVAPALLPEQVGA